MELVFEWRLTEGKGLGQVDLWRKDVPGRGNSKYKGTG